MNDRFVSFVYSVPGFGKAHTAPKKELLVVATARLSCMMVDVSGTDTPP